MFSFLTSLLLTLITQSPASPIDTNHQGVEPQPLVFGMSTALTGPAGELGQEMRRGVLAAFSEINANGGIKGRPLKLIALDDGYEPKVTVPNMKKLISEHQSLAVIGNVGTPTAVSALPLVEEFGIPFVFPYTGAGNLRLKKPSSWVTNYRASYAQETAAMVDALMDVGGLKPEDIAFFTQRDSYGDAGFLGGVAALERRGLKSRNEIAHGRYERNTLAVEKGFAEILMAKVQPKAVIMVGTYAPCAKVIRLAREYQLEILFLNVSFVGATSLASQLGEDADDVIVTQVVPHFHSELKLVKEYRKALRAGEENLPLDKRTAFSFPSLP